MFCSRWKTGIKLAFREVAEHSGDLQHGKGPIGHTDSEQWGVVVLLVASPLFVVADRIVGLSRLAFVSVL